MKYIGEFRNIHNELLTLVISTANGFSSDRTITLGGSPITVEYAESKNTLYKPVRYSGATIQLISSDYEFDLYSGKALGTKVELLKGDTLLWVGYIEPNLYNMGFVEERETIELECIDALSTLQYIKYSVGNNISFKDLFLKAMKQLRSYGKYAYNQIYISNCLSERIDSLSISETNFINSNSKGDEEWTYKDVLEEVCQYLGMTLFADGDTLYLIDYDAIKAGNNEYYGYNINGADLGTKTVSHTKTIVGEDYSDTGATISLGNVYNKVVVKTNVKEYDNLLPNPFDDATNITAEYDDYLGIKLGGQRTSFEEYVGKRLFFDFCMGEIVQNSKDIGGSTIKDNMVAIIDRVYDPQKKQHTNYNSIYVKYFANNKYKFYVYDKEGNCITVNERGEYTPLTEMKYGDTKKYNGAFLTKFDVNKLDISVDYDKAVKGEVNLDTYVSDMKTNISLGNYIMLLNNHIDNSKIRQYPFFELSNNKISGFYGGKDSYLIISGSYYFHFAPSDPYPIPDGEVDISEGRYAINDGDAHLLCKLQLGTKYWNGKAWTDVESTFKLPYIKDGADKYARRADANVFKHKEFVNTVSWRIGTKEKGYCIPTEGLGLIDATPTLTVYKPYDPTYTSTKSGSNKGQHYKMHVVFLKDFQIKAIVSDPTFGDSVDTLYTNVISDDYVKKLDDIEMKVCTYDNKKPNYSSVVLYKNGVYNWLDTIIHNNEDARFEVHLINKIRNQYREPSIVLNLSLKGDYKLYGLYKDTTIKDKNFIVDGYTKDYKLDTIELKLIEKK